ncbi:MAG TPA: L-serine ammonia-lyase, iron-sulfur-dependent, subunit alpha [Candidatus Mediterraneibacter excrementavium]|nr:L-serine ammonia-lyase, iron-sulfur-dependent, subunit alpha [Candidatus Mediterraneibacter excrementavium]
MKKDDIRYQTYVNILKEELIPAFGCTEPIALAYAAAKARQILGVLPDRVLLQVSGSIIKNVKSVIVPNTGHLKGMPAAAAAGIIAGDPDRELEVISQVSEEKIKEIRAFLENVRIDVEHIDNGHVFDIIVTEYKDGHSARVRILDTHTDIVLIEKDGAILYEKPAAQTPDVTHENTIAAAQTSDRNDACSTDRALLNMEDIWDFITTVDISDISGILDRQIRFNSAIAEEGLRGDYGANIGTVLLRSCGNDIATRAKAWAAAGSDARMNGCELPVIINSGSGNQGITCSVPLIEYARELKSDHETLCRALALSNLVAIHEKTGIGTLSAYCGAVSAGAGAGAGIAYLCGGDYQAVIHTVVNALAITSGIVCDGAKASCAAKIAFSVDAGILGYHMYQNGQEFKSGDGIVMKDIESTIRGIGLLGKDGMKETNNEIIRLMVGEEA